MLSLLRLGSGSELLSGDEARYRGFVEVGILGVGAHIGRVSIAADVGDQHAWIPPQGKAACMNRAYIYG